MPTSNKNASFNYKNNRKVREDKKTDRNAEDATVFLDLPPTANSDQNLPGEADGSDTGPAKGITRRTPRTKGKAQNNKD